MRLIEINFYDKYLLLTLILAPHFSTSGIIDEPNQKSSPSPANNSNLTKTDDQLSTNNFSAKNSKTPTAEKNSQNEPLVTQDFSFNSNDRNSVENSEENSVSNREKSSGATPAMKNLGLKTPTKRSASSSNRKSTDDFLDEILSTPTTTLGRMSKKRKARNLFE